MKLTRILLPLLLASPLFANAQAPTVTLGPEINVGVTYQSGTFTQYQTDLRCNPLNAQEFSIACKYKGEVDTLLFHTADGGTTWQATQWTNSGDPDVIYDNDGGAHWSVIDKANGKKLSCRRSLDGGVTWEAAKLTTTASVDHPHLTCDRSNGANRGTLYLAGRGISSSTRLYVTRSADRGVTWTQKDFALPASVGAGFVSPPLVMRNGTLVIPIQSKNTILADSSGYYAGSLQNAYVIRSTDGGNTVSAPVLITDTNGYAGTLSPGSRSITLASGMWQGVERLYAIHSEEATGRASELQLCTSDDGGSTWTAPRSIIPLTPAGWGQGGCMAAMVNQEGVLGVQYYAFKPGTIDQFDLYFAASVDGGATFTTPVRVSTVTSKEPAGQVREPGGDHVYADVGADGTFHLVWTDARNGATNYRVYYRSVRVTQAPVEVILDNTSATGVIKQGTWTNSTAASGYYGSNYMHDGNTARGTKWVRYNPTLPSPGTYDVYLRWTAGSNRASNVPVDIGYNGGVGQFLINQRVAGSAWFLLGSYSFTAGANGYLLISNTATNGYVIADAVRFVRR